MLENLPPLPAILAEILVLFLGIGLHEYAHCKFADLAGDPTPRYYGRVTLNLTKHFEPLGTLMMFLSSLMGFGIGWGRAAPSDPKKMKNPRWDFFVSVAAGPISNIAQAVVYAFILRLLLTTGKINDLSGFVGEFIKYLILYGVQINITLCLFNLIPFGPLDGHWLVGLLMPEPLRWRWFRFNSAIGMQGLIITVVLLQISHIPLLSGPVTAIFEFLTGTTL